MNSIIPNIAYARQIHGTTTLFLTNFSNKVITPKPIKWDQIDFEHTWTIPRNNKSQPKENDQVQNIIERPDGTVIINFNPKPSNIVESRPSMSARPSTSSNSESRKSFQSAQTHMTNTIPNQIPTHISYPVYPNQPKKREDNEFNPTESDFGSPPHQINMITLNEPTQFIIDKEKLKNDLKKSPNTKIFFKSFSQKEQQQLKELWFSDMEQNQEEIFFFDWLKSKFSTNSIQMIKSTLNQWQTSKGQIINSTLPPFKSITYSKNTAIPIKKETMFSNPTPASQKDLSHVIEQNNYTNIYLHTLGQQIEKLHVSNQASTSTNSKLVSPIAFNTIPDFL